jgi:hypothetical protein
MGNGQPVKRRWTARGESVEWMEIGLVPRTEAIGRLVGCAES